ncbi:MAG: response regulator transcription factor [Verrucomicrobiota bacterium]
MKAKKIRILIADDHFVVRMGLMAIINTEPDMEVVGEAADGFQVVELCEKLKPDLVLMDLSMPRKDGIAAAIDIFKAQSAVRVLMLTTFDGDTDIHRALEAGIQGYILKSTSGDQLIPALRAVAAGQKWIPSDVAKRLESRNLYDELTPRELQVLQQMARGLANKEIADVLKITGYTAKDHTKSILSKLGVADRTEAVTVALRRGIIRLEQEQAG